MSLLILSLMATSLPPAERIPIPPAAETALERGDRRQAYDLTREAMERCRRDDNAGDRCLDLLITAANLARGVLPDEEAEPLARRAVADAVRWTGESRDTGIALNNLAMLLGASNRFSEAWPLYRRALRIAEATADRDAATLRVIATNFAATLETQGRLLEAEPLRRRALALAGQDDDTTTQVAAARALAINLLRQSRYAEAETFARRIVALDGSSIQDLSLLARIMQNQGRAEDALPLRRHVLALWEDRAGADDARTLSAVSDLATTTSHAGRAAEAEPLYRRALEGYRRLKAGPGVIAIAEANLGRTLDSLGRSVEAEPLHRSAARSSEAQFGEADDFTATIFAGLAANLAAQGKAAEAEAYYRRALKGRQATGVRTRTDWIDGHADLAGFLLSQGRGVDEARSLLQRAREGVEARLATFADAADATRAELNGWRAIYEGQVAAAWRLAGR